MMRGIKSKLRGVCRVEISGAFPESVLNACAASCLVVYQPRRKDEYTMSLFVAEKDYAALEALAEGCSCRAERFETIGGSTLRQFLKNHLGIIIALALIVALFTASSLFIWDFDVYGCEKLTEGEVLRALSECGVDIGTYWPGISTELVRAQMLTRLPSLAWMTVNISSSRAVVLVSERLEKPEIYDESRGADIVARREGIIKRISAKNGAPAVGVGESVTAGERLISGGMESAAHGVRIVRARGEVIADTWHELTAICPAETAKKTARGMKYARYALKLGKNRYNFYFSSGNTVDGCDKIVHNYKLGVDGLFALPVSLVVEEFIPYKTEAVRAECADAMGARLLERLNKTVKGEVLSHSLSKGESGDLIIVTLRAACEENIAQLVEYN